MNPVTKQLLATSVAFSLFLTSCTALAEPLLVGKVVSITDGDTLILLDDQRQQRRIRLAGIDAPERSQPFGQVSTTHLSELCFSKLVVADCPKSDRYGRLVCVVRVNGTDIGLQQVEAGLAWHYKKYAREQSDEDKHAYASAEGVAREGRKGLWGASNPIAPWDWRHRGKPTTSSEQINNSQVR